MPKRTDIRSILIIGAGPSFPEFPAKAGTHLPAALAVERWIPASAGISAFFMLPRVDA